MRYSCFDELHEQHGPVMSTAAVAKLMHSHPSHIRAMAQSGDLPAVRVGSRWKFPTAKIAALVDGVGVDGE